MNAEYTDRQRYASESLTRPMPLNMRKRPSSKHHAKHNRTIILGGNKVFLYYFLSPDRLFR